MSAPVRARPVTTSPWVRVAAVAALVLTTVGTLRTWSSTLQRSSVTLDARPAWTSGVVPAIGAGLAVVGAAVLVAALFRRSGGRLAVAAAAVGVAGAAVLLIDRYAAVSGPDGVAPVTVAIGYYQVDRPNPFVRMLPGAVVSVTSGALLTLAVLVAVVATVRAVPARPVAVSPARWPVALAAVGVVAVVVGAVVFPWRFGAMLDAEPLVRAGGATAVGAGLTVLGGLLLVTAGLRGRARSRAFAALAVSAVGLGLVLPSRLPAPWQQAGDFGWYAYQPLEALTLPGPGQFLAATTFVLVGAVLCCAAGTLLTWRGGAAAPAAVA